MEMPMWGGAITRQQLLQSISLFQTLDGVPEPPKDNCLMTDNNERYCLSVLREKEITSNLAFLSSISDNRLRVMAVCIEEHDNKEELTIRIASNTGDLSTVARGFELMAQVLERAARRENPKLQDQESLLKQIVELDFYRILARLRSRHARKSSKGAGKPPLISQLSGAVQAWVTESGRERIQSLLGLFVQLESLPDLYGDLSEARELLSEIVKEARELTLAIDLKAILENSPLEPSLKEYFLEAIGKVGRYYAAASDLISAARHKTYRVFLKVHVKTFQVQVPPSIKEMKGELQLSSLPDSIVYSSKRREKKLENDLQKRMAEISMNRKIHAEIQLLFFYELNPDSPRPRFICSSKKACYLCDLFLHIHGGFSSPRTHGRLYDMWILPDWLDIPIQRRRDLAVITQRFKDALDDKIEKTLTSGPKKHPHPTESCVPSEAHYSSTEPSDVLALGSQTSISTLRPHSTLSQEVISSTEMPLDTGSPSTLPGAPRVPPQITGTINVNPEKMTPPDAIKLANSKIESAPSSDPTSLITVRQKYLPYSKLITLATPTLYVRLDRLSVTLEFAETVSGRLFIMKSEEDESRVNVVDIKDILTTSERSVHCSQESNELQFSLQSRGKGIIYIKFVWDDAK